MSFYFNLRTSEPFPTIDVLKALHQPNVGWVGDEPGDKVFYNTGKSLRGVCIYPTDDGIDIGLNAFTTRDDAVLARDIVDATSRLLDCMVTPENMDAPITPDMVLPFCDDDWIEERYAEALSVARMIADKPADQLMKITGYCRGYAISQGRMQALLDGGMTQHDAIALLLSEGITVQELDQREDIYAARPMSITAPVKKEKSGFWGKKTSEEEESFTAFSLAPGVRTLTPVFLSQGPEFAILGDKEYGYRRVAHEEVRDYARRIGAREYGAGSFDLTVNGDDYNDLFWAGEEML